MLQRVQSIFLLLVALAMILFAVFPLWQKNDVGKSQSAEITSIYATQYQVDKSLDTREVILQKPIFYVAALAVLAACVAFYSIFRYDNRLLQMKLGALNSLLIGGTIFLTFWTVREFEPLLAPNTAGIYTYTFYGAIGALLFNMIANRFIRRDEQLVKSADRIR